LAILEMRSDGYQQCRELSVGDMLATNRVLAVTRQQQQQQQQQQPRRGSNTPRLIIGLHWTTHEAAQKTPFASHERRQCGE